MIVTGGCLHYERLARYLGWQDAIINCIITIIIITIIIDCTITIITIMIMLWMFTLWTFG